MQIVTCLKCKHISEGTVPFLDLSVAIQKCSRVEQAVQKHLTVSPVDDGAQVYNCLHCNELTSATQKFSLHTAPHILCLHLKR